jgi:hypothetical protein
VQLYLLLSSKPDGGKWPTSGPDRCTPRIQRQHLLIGGQVGPRYRLLRVQGFEPLIVQSSRSTDYADPAPYRWRTVGCCPFCKVTAA